MKAYDLPVSSKMKKELRRAASAVENNDEVMFDKYASLTLVFIILSGVEPFHLSRVMERLN